jgi:CARDB
MRVGHWVALCGLAFASAACTGDLATDSDAESGSGSQAVAGPAPDYVVTAVADPPASALNGGSFSLQVTVQNVGTAAALVSSTTRYYLSLDTVIGGDRVFAAKSVVPPLAVGGADTRSVTLAIPPAPAGNYHVLACADRTAVIPELDNRNNCTATAGTVAVTGPDLVVEALSEPPPQLMPFASFAITDTTRNIGTAAAAASTVAYFLSSVPVRQPGSPRLGRPRAAGPLAEGAASSATVTVFVPNLPPGSYFLVACADSGKRVVEADEKNNCRPSTGTLHIPAPDLTVTSLAEPPGAILAGDSLALAVTTANQGTLDASSTATRFFLSLDGEVGDDLSVVGSRRVPALATGATAALTARLSIARTTPTGDYFVIACADGAAALPELSEANNCRVSTSPIAVTRPAAAAAEVTVRLLGRPFIGDPEPGQPVLAHGPDGSLAARVATDASGTAQIAVPAGGSMTVVELESRHITTFYDVETGDVLTVGESTRIEFLGFATVIVPPSSPENFIAINGPCASSTENRTEDSLEVALISGCGTGPQPLMAELHETVFNRSLIGYLFDPEVDLVPGGTVAMDGDWLPPLTFPVDITGFPDDAVNATLTFARLLGLQEVSRWQGTGVGETLTFADGRMVGSILHAVAGEGLLADIRFSSSTGFPPRINRILDYRLTELDAQVSDVSEDMVTVATATNLLQGELEPGGPQDVVGVAWDMHDGATVDGMVIRIKKQIPDVTDFAWTVVLPPRPIGSHELTLPRLPSDLVAVWAGGVILDWRASAVDSAATSYAEFRPDAEPQHLVDFQPTTPGKVLIGGGE